MVPRSNEEVWRQVAGFEHYEVSNMGRIRRITYLRPYSSKGTKYPSIQLFDSNGVRQKAGVKAPCKKKLFHRLLAEAFLPNPGNLPYVNHKDGDKSNFSLDNLEWCTHGQNMLHAYKTGLNRGGKSQQNRMVIQVGKDFSIERVWKGVRELRLAKYTWNKVYDSIRRGLFYRGFKWLYLDVTYDYNTDTYFKKVDGFRVYVDESETGRIAESVVRQSLDRLAITPPSRNKIIVAARKKGVLLGVFSSIMDAAKETGCDRAEIGRSIKSGKPTKGIAFLPATLEEYTEYINQNQIVK